MKRFKLPLILAVAPLAVSVAGCGGDSDPPADVHGNYTLSVTNGPSTCPLSGWTQGTNTPGIPFTVAQNGQSISADVGGAGAIFLGLWCGNAHLEGAVSGSSLDLTLAGTRSLSSGSCAFTVDAQLVATVEKDALAGSITYKPNTNSSADCAAVRTCTARMNLSGTRPPSAD